MGDAPHGIAEAIHSEAEAEAPAQSSNVASLTETPLLCEGAHDRSTATSTASDLEAADVALTTRNQRQMVYHGCTSLLLQERGAVTQTHFDTGPYHAISFHVI